MSPRTIAQDIQEQREAIKADSSLTSRERYDLLTWCDEGCPGDEPTDVGFEDGDFA